MAAAATIITDSVATDTVWTKEASPYLIPAGISVLPGATLVLDPGVVIKLDKVSDFEVNGTLIASGTAADPVVITSINDDSAGGDTGGYAATFPTIPAGPVVTGSRAGNDLSLGLSDGSHVVYYTWVSSLGVGGDGYLDAPSLALPQLAGSNVEALITSSQIDGSCLGSIYTGNIDADLACALRFAASNGIPVLRYEHVSPSPGDWRWPIHFAAGSQGFLSHVVFRYGGYHDCTNGCIDRPMLSAEHANIEISDATFSDGQSAAVDLGSGAQVDVTNSAFSGFGVALRLDGGRLTVRNSAFDNLSIGTYVSVDASTSVDAVGNWWGDPTGPKDSFGLSGAGAESDAATNVPWLFAKPFAGATSTVPVWFLAPGPMIDSSTGTSSTPAAPTTAATATDPVIIVPGILGSIEYGGRWVLDPILHTYDDLVDTFLANGYVASSTLFTFPYDWRLPNEETAQLLKAKIDGVKIACGCEKVDVIAHSMGGLVVRAYAQSPDYAGDINKVVFLGTPHHGAPEAYLAAEGGQFGSSLSDALLKALFTLYAREQGYSDAFYYIKDRPVASVPELLPIYDYLKVASTSAMEHYPAGYPANSFLLDLDQGLSPLLSSGINLMNIIGDEGTDTISAIDVGAHGYFGKWTNGQPTALEYGAGDGTVPLESAAIASSTDTTIVSRHIELPGLAEGAAFKFLTGKEATTTIHRSLPQKILFAAMHSPARIEVIAPDGSRVGWDSTTQSAVDGIPGAFYSEGQEGLEYAIVPDPADGEYRFEADGTDNGSYTMEVRNISEATTTISTYSGTISTDQSIDLTATVSSTTISSIKIYKAPKPPAITTTISGSDIHQSVSSSAGSASVSGPSMHTAAAPIISAPPAFAITLTDTSPAGPVSPTAPLSSSTVAPSTLLPSRSDSIMIDISSASRDGRSLRPLPPRSRLRSASSTATSSATSTVSTRSLAFVYVSLSRFFGWLGGIFARLMGKG
ncbi:MAG: hypothetical protein KGH68_01315 [Patescibacteria group bacterium]|nr:hypothetical protein [Patescibacteria group bacterium]